jgi:hypothetical protein
MSAYDTPSQESSGTDIEDRTRRALERALTVTHTDGTPIAADESPTVVSVHSGNSGKEHRVDVREGRCTCPDHEHRDSVCYHIRRARIALGRQPVHRDTLAACDVHGRLAEHAPGPVVVTSDGGVVGATGGQATAPDNSDSTTSDRVDPRVREHVEQHGSPTHGYDHAPDRSEPADFGGGETTGVQDL